MEDTKPQDTPDTADASLENAEAPKVAPEEDAKKELLYLRAEFDNYRKRMARDQEQAVRFANERFIKELMTLADQLDRALEHSGPVKKEATSAVKTFVEGIELTGREFNQWLARIGVELVGVKGEAFDPSKHEAISEQESSDVAAGKVLAVLQKGCQYQGRLLQPAKVIVAQEKKLKTEN